MKFPQYRARRMRATPNIRRMVRETRLSPDMLIYPMFVAWGKGKQEEISSMPGNFRLSVDRLAAVLILQNFLESRTAHPPAAGENHLN